MRSAEAIDTPADAHERRRTRLALDAGQLLIRDRERNIEARGWQLAMGDTIRNDVDSESLYRGDYLIRVAP